MAPLRPYAVLTASILIQVCLGGLYAWSVLVGPLQREWGITTVQAQVIFGTTIACFTLTMVVAGRALECLGPRRVVAAGALLYAAGHLVASQSAGEFPTLLLGLGVIAGAGIGCGYVCPLAVAVRWFPQARGLVTGVVVAGMGGGAILLTHLASRALGGGMPVLEWFSWVGVLYGGVILAAGSVLSFPPSAAVMAPGPRTLPFRKDRGFWSLAVGMFCGTAAGLLVVGNLKPMALSLGIPEGMALVAVSLFAAGNAGGRIIWGALGDRMGTRSAILGSLFLAGVSLAVLPLTEASAPGFLAAVVVVALAFGACFVVYAAHIAATYGPDLLPAVYPYVFLGYGLAALVGPSTGGWLYDATQSYTAATGLASVICFAGAAGFTWLSRPCFASREAAEQKKECVA